MRLQSHPYGPLLAALQASAQPTAGCGWTRCPPCGLLFQAKRGRVAGCARRAPVKQCKQWQQCNVVTRNLRARDMTPAWGRRAYT
jgi:hypothetical protein